MVVFKNVLESTGNMGYIINTFFRLGEYKLSGEDIEQTLMKIAINSLISFHEGRFVIRTNRISTDTVSCIYRGARSRMKEKDCKCPAVPAFQSNLKTF